jgi:hypothetical protein
MNESDQIYAFRCGRAYQKASNLLRQLTEFKKEAKTEAEHDFLENALLLLSDIRILIAQGDEGLLL